LTLHIKGRYLVRETDFKKVVFENVVVRSTIWLFNDLILVAKRKEKNKFHFRVMFPLDCCIVWDLDPNGSGIFFYYFYFIFILLIINDFNFFWIHKTGPPEKKNAFSIFRNDKKTEKLIIFAASPKEKSEWIDLVNDCVATCSNFLKEKE
jgi:hypothetical protein